MTFSVGLTGGIGSGKSTVADKLAELGAVVVDTDVIAHQLTAPDGAAIEPLARTFGRDVLTPSGALDRPQMRERAFTDAKVKAQLEAILHPLIRDAAESRAAAALASPYVVFVVPLLVESRTWRQRVSRVLVVDCSSSTQIMRVQRRSGWNANTVRTVMRAQAPRRVRLDAADDVLINEGDTAALDSRIARLHAHYLHTARQTVHRPVA